MTTLVSLIVVRRVQRKNRNNGFKVELGQIELNVAKGKTALFWWYNEQGRSTGSLRDLVDSPWAALSSPNSKTQNIHLKL